MEMVKEMSVKPIIQMQEGKWHQIINNGDSFEKCEILRQNVINEQAATSSIDS